jgi:hypothetical protein
MPDDFVKRILSSPCLDFRTEAHKKPQYFVDGFGPLNEQVSCEYLHFAQTEDIWLKSALEGETGVLLITACYIVVDD